MVKSATRRDSACLVAELTNSCLDVNSTPLVDSLAVVEDAYDLSLDIEQWLLRLLGQLEPMLAPSDGMLGFHYEINRAGRMRVRQHATRKMPKWREKAILFSTPLAPAELAKAIHVTGAPLTGLHASFEGRIGQVYRRLPAVFQRAVPEVVAFNAFDPTGRGLLVGAHRNRPAEPLDPALVARWTRVAAHIAAGLRLRLAGASDEAVVDPGQDKVVHAEGEARDARQNLREAAVRIDRARLRSTEVDDGLRMWTALIDGTWSLLETFERDGRRYFVARRNDASTRDPRRLTQRQRQVAALAAMGRSDKVIAYTLGISESTARTHLIRALRRLGIGGRRELLRFVRFSADSHR